MTTIVMTFSNDSLASLVGRNSFLVGVFGALVDFNPELYGAYCCMRAATEMKGDSKL